MNRVIKFRFWKANTKEMITLKQALEYLVDVPNLIEGKYDNFIPMQFTGLHDKNGVEIYEGDIIQFLPHKERSEVKYEEGSFVYYKNVRVSFHSEERELRQDSLVNLLTDHEYGNHCEVIGNIFKNPELMGDA